MKIATDKNNNLIYVDWIQEHQPYYCPECHQMVVVKTSRRGKRYFAHLRKSNNHHGETSEHLSGKYQIFQWAKQNGWRPRLEVRLPSIDQRADILCLVNKQTVAIEFQCSPLTLKAMINRNRGYQLSNIKCYWFLGGRYLKNIHADKIAQFMHWHHDQPVLYFWDVSHGKLNIKRFDNYKHSLFREINEMKRLIHSCQSSSRRQLANLAYQRGHILSCCPLYVHSISVRFPLLKEGILEWRIRSILVLESYPLESWFTIKQWRKFLILLGCWNTFPCLTKGEFKQLQNQLIIEWTRVLQGQGIIEIYDQVCVIKKRPIWFGNVDQKMAALNPKLVK